MKNSMTASPRPCLDGSLINAKSFLICSSFLHLQWRIHWLAYGAKLGCGSWWGLHGLYQSLGVVAFGHHLQNHIPGLWPLGMSLSLCPPLSRVSHLTGGRGPRRSEVPRECQGHKMWPEPPTCCKGQIHIPQLSLIDINSRLEPLAWNMWKIIGYKSIINVHFYLFCLIATKIFSN